MMIRLLYLMSISIITGIGVRPSMDRMRWEGPTAGTPLVFLIAGLNHVCIFLPTSKPSIGMIPIILYGLIAINLYWATMGYPSPWHHGIMVAETAWWPHQVRRAFRALPVERCGCATIQVAKWLGFHPQWLRGLSLNGVHHINSKKWKLLVIEQYLNPYR